MAPIDEVKLQKLLALVEAEFRRASSKNEAFHSCHEGYSILAEEVDELWDEVKKKTKMRSTKLMRSECKQIAAMAVRFMHDLL